MLLLVLEFGLVVIVELESLEKLFNSGGAGGCGVVCSIGVGGIDLVDGT